MSSSLPPTGGEQPPLRSRALTIIVVALVAALVVGGLLWLIGGRDSSPDDGEAGGPGSTPTPTATTSPSSPASSPTAPATGGTGGTKTPGTATTKPSATPRKPQRIPFEETGRPAADVDLRVAEVETINAKGHIPGEISGPALRITVEVENRSDRAIPLNTTVANFYYGKDRTPASPMTLSGSRAFPAKAGPGATVSGVFVFTVPKSDRNRINLEVVLDNSLRIVEFNGGCPEDC